MRKRRRLVVSPVTVDEPPWATHFSSMYCRNIGRLHRFAERLGIPRERFREHVRWDLFSYYLITRDERARALESGAVFVSSQEWADRALALWRKEGFQP